MIIIGFVGGIGNQMFEYSLYEALKYRGKEVYFDLSFFDEGDHRKHRIDNFIDLDLPVVDKEITVKYRDSSRDIFSRVRRKIFGISRAQIYMDKETGFQPEIFELDNVYLQGFWQSELYFNNVKEKIKSQFVLYDQTNDYQKNILMDIEANNSVSIHIRRGDYLALNNLYGGICTEKYYEEAIRKFKGMNCKFYVFSDDYEYAKYKFNGDGFTVVQSFEKFPEANMDLYLMSRCKHNIIANSSFSWWAAWLNSNRDKIVIAPDKWLNKPIDDVQCSNWVRIKGSI